jgi:hypothetical protein
MIPDDVLYFDCPCGIKSLKLKNGFSAECDCGRVYIIFYDEAGDAYANMVYHPDSAIDSKEHNRKIPTYIIYDEEIY